MEQLSILIISDKQADADALSACLSRAAPQHFTVVKPASMKRPLESLLTPAVDAIVMAEEPETDYLLRLARKHRVAPPIVLLLDQLDEDTAGRLREYDAQGYLLRSELQDAVAQRVLDYSIQLGRARSTIDQLSNRDSLTGALNRAGFRAHLERALNRAERYHFKSALLYFNIDRFTSINDQYGESKGDQMLKTLAQRVMSKLRVTDSLARLGGDEFAVILEDLGSDAELEYLAERIGRSLAEPVTLSEQQQLSVDVSMGTAMYPEDALAQPDLIEAAQSAMLQAKDIAGSRCIRYCGKLHFDGPGTTSLAAQLRTAARKGEFELRYQPRVDLSTGLLAGLEALLRWNHPERGLLCPAEFLTECEDMGLMRTIGYQVIQQACEALNWLDEHGLGHVDIAVNVSFSQMEDERFPEVVRAILDRTGADAHRLEFELTENTILQDPRELKARMEQLRQLGITFSLDDFGTGFSQLSHLSDLPIEALKVDAAFVRDLPHNPRQVAVCSMLIAMAHKLSMRVIAEGAETHEQVEFLRQHQCHEVQGFYYSVAVPLHQLPGLVKEQRFKGRLRLLS